MPVMTELTKAASLMTRAAAAVPAPSRELRQSIAGCLKATRDSLPRVDSPGAGVAASAARSVGSAAMRAAWIAASREDVPAGAAFLFAEAAVLSLNAVTWETPEHRAGIHDDPAPAGWHGPDGGPFVTRTRGFTLAITVRPHLPGGDWSLFCGGVPVMSGKGPEACARAAELIVGTLELGH
jgi:hypothetical protein